jgi:hypothetical protein
MTLPLDLTQNGDPEFVPTCEAGGTGEGLNVGNDWRARDFGKVPSPELGLAHSNIRQGRA